MSTQAVPGFFDRLDSFLYRNRHWLGPIGVACGLAVLAAVAHYAHLWWVAAIVAGLVWLLQWPDTIDLPDWREKGYALGCWTAGGAWLVAASYWGQLIPLFGVQRFPLYVLAVLTLAGGVPWFYHQRVRRGVEVDRLMPAWGDGSAVGLPGTEVRGTKADRHTYTFKVFAKERGRYTIGQFKQAKERIAALRGVHADAVTIAQGGHAGEAYVTIRESEIERVGHDTTREIGSIVGPHRIGQYDDGNAMNVALYMRNQGAKSVVVIGTLGSGKSGLLNDLAMWAVTAPDALLIIIDLSKGSVEMRAWAPACASFADTPQKAERVFEIINGICESRGQRMTGRVWEPTPEDPMPVVIIDEGATLFAPDLLPAGSEIEDRIRVAQEADARAAKFGDITQQARKYGVAMAEATTFGVEAAFGGSKAKSELLSGYAFVFRTARNQDGHLLINAGTLNGSEIPHKPGTCGATGPTIDNPGALGRVDWLTDEDRRSIVARHKDRQPELNAEDARHSGWASRPRLFLAAEVEEVDERPKLPVFGSLKDTPKRHRTPEDSLNTVWMALAQFPRGAGPTQVAKKASKSVPLVSARLNELVEAGRAAKQGRGLYVAVTDDVASLGA